MCVALMLRQALGAVRQLVREPYHLESDVQLFDALAEFGPVAGLYRRMVSDLDPSQRAHLESLTRRPVDLESLAALPEGTLGRAYIDWLSSNGLVYDYFLQAFPPSRARLERNWVMLRFAKTHDLHHVVLGLQASVPEETALQVFNLLNFREPYGAASVVGLPWLLWVYREHGVRSTLDLMRRVVPWSWRLPNLFAFPFEDHYADDLVDVRRQLGIPEQGILA